MEELPELVSYSISNMCIYVNISKPDTQSNMKALDVQFIAGVYDPFSTGPLEEVENESDHLLPPSKPKLNKHSRASEKENGGDEEASANGKRRKKRNGRYYY